MVGRHVGFRVTDADRRRNNGTSSGGYGRGRPSSGRRFNRRRLFAFAAATLGAAAGAGQLYELKARDDRALATDAGPPHRRRRAPGSAAPREDAVADADVTGDDAHPAHDGPMSPVAWTRYHGAVRDAPAWAAAQRGGWFFADDGSLDRDALAARLHTHDVAVGPALRPPIGDADGIREFMERVRMTNGAWWRDTSYRWVHDLIETHRQTPHKVISVGTGNEVNHPEFRRLLGAWAIEQGLPFPHPRSAYGDALHVDDRDHLGYYVEHFLAPAVEGARQANAEAAPEDRIPIQLGTVVGIWDAILDTFLPALVEYRIEGAFAPSLAGLRVADVVDRIGVHYLLTAERIGGYVGPDGTPVPYGYHGALDALDDRWRGNGNISGIWLTEEGGNVTQQRDQHASLAVRVFARSMSWITRRGATPDEFRVFGYYQGPPGGWGAGYAPRRETSWDFGMTVVHDFLGHDARLIDCSAGVVAAVVDPGDPVEAYGFETDDRRRRVVIVTPQSVSWQGATEVTALRTAFGGWRDARVTATVNLFRSDADAYRRFGVDVVANVEAGCFEMTLPEPIALNAAADHETLMIELTRLA